MAKKPDDKRSPGSSDPVQPTTETDWRAYFDLRWRVLRQLWGQPRGSERDDLDGASFHLMIRGSGDEPVAIGRLHRNSPEEAQVRYMAVDPSWQGRGLGGRILDALEAQARAESVKCIVLDAREKAVNFYLNRGYQVEGPAKTLFGTVRHVRMRKDLLTPSERRSSSRYR